MQDRFATIRIGLEYIKSFYGRWYIWGGSDPAGFDCSGLAIEYLKAIGLLGRKGDWTAHMLYKKFEAHETEKPSLGCLCFWWREGRMGHVGIYVGEGLYIGAEGGGSHVKTMEQAIIHDAFIKLRPLRPDPIFVDVFKVLEVRDAEQ